MVRVLAVADEVADSIYHESVRRHGAELVLAAGDLPWDYLEFLSSALNVPVVFVPGNHDPEVESPQEGMRGLLTGHGMPTDDPRPLGCTNADGAIIDVKGLRVAGLGGSIRYNGGPNQYTDRAFARRAGRLLKQAGKRGGPVDVLLTHSPPRGLGDEDDRPHRGFEALPDVIGSMQPTWHLHGHIHPHGFRKPDRTLGSTTIRNVIPWQLIEIEPRVGVTATLRRGA
ncbi:metallophosphoesterase [Aeromicrobium sp. CF4.19]|uniref:metallophosphoesterase family protein n=1 Tax=Aeromicrobium sp. CF4.19 TaxID=3373082 RepID=UPI003EE733B9